MDYVVVTGASSGIGYAIAELLTKKGYHVFGSVRKKSDAEKLKANLGSTFTPLIFDVTNKEQILNSAKEVRNMLNNKNLAALINNAGIVVSGPIQLVPVSEFKYQFEVNVFGQLSVIQAFLPLLGAKKDNLDKPGKIINISSISGKVTAPMVGAYAASKHAFESLSDGLRRELSIFGIDVIVVEPGPVKTPIWGKALTQESPYKDTIYREFIEKTTEQVKKSEANAIEPDRVSKIVEGILKGSKKKTRYIITRNSWIIKLLLVFPDKLVDKFLLNRIKIKK